MVEEQPSAHDDDRQRPDRHQRCASWNVEWNTRPGSGTADECEGDESAARLDWCASLCQFGDELSERAG